MDTDHFDIIKLLQKIRSDVPIKEEKIDYSILSLPILECRLKEYKEKLSRYIDTERDSSTHAWLRKQVAALGEEIQKKKLESKTNESSAYEEWENEVLEEFAKDNSSLYDEFKDKEDAINVTEAGEVFVHAGGAYPLIFKGYKKWSEYAREHGAEESKVNVSEKTWRARLLDDLRVDTKFKALVKKHGVSGDEVFRYFESTYRLETASKETIEKALKDSVKELELSESKTNKDEYPGSSGIPQSYIDALEDTIISAYKKARKEGKSREEATQIASRASKGQADAPAVRRLLGIRGVKESKFSFVRKQKHLWLCNDCAKTFRANVGICEKCKGENIEKITEGDVEAIGLYKDVYEVWYKDKNGKSSSTRVEAFDKADAERMVKKSKAAELGKITKVEKVSEGKDQPGKHNGTGPAKGSYQRRRHGSRGKRKQAGEKCPLESKLTETVSELIGEVPDIGAEENQILRWALRSGVLFNEWPPNEILIAGLQEKLPKEEKDKLETAESIDLHILYLKHILLPRAKKAWNEEVEKQTGISLESIKEDAQAVAKIVAGTKSVEGASLEELQDSLEFVNILIQRKVGPDSFWESVRNIIQKAIDKRKGVSEELTPGGMKALRAPKLRFNYGTVEDHAKVMKDLAKTETFSKTMVGTQVTLVDAKGIPATYAKDEDLKWKPWTSLGFVEESKINEQGIDVKRLSDEELIKDYKTFKWSLDSGMYKSDWVIVGWLKDNLERVENEMEERGLELPSKEEVKKDVELQKKGQESKILEQEKDTYNTIAKGVIDKTEADRIARDKKGMTVQDEEDPKKFMVIVKESEVK